VSLSDSEPLSSCEKNGVFNTTHWSVVVSAANPDAKGSDRALQELCGTYWYPLYAYLRRRGYREHDAQDLTQDFFAHLFERKALHRVDREKGRFRSFLLGSLNYFLADERDRTNAQKRGGGRELLSLDAQDAEERYRLEPVDERTPEKLFERRWALTLLDQVFTKLAREFSESGKEELFRHLQPFLIETTGSKSYAVAAPEAGISEEAFKKAVQRLRQRYQKLFREEIAQTVADQAEVDEELRYLCEVLSAST
jgi:DNA-directed RNA polymerase specialized sigma24 family protein